MGNEAVVDDLGFIVPFKGGHVPQKPFGDSTPSVHSHLRMSRLLPPGVRSSTFFKTFKALHAIESFSLLYLFPYIAFNRCLISIRMEFDPRSTLQGTRCHESYN